MVRSMRGQRRAGQGHLLAQPRSQRHEGRPVGQFRLAGEPVGAVGRVVQGPWRQSHEAPALQRVSGQPFARQGDDQILLGGLQHEAEVVEIGHRLATQAATGLRGLHALGQAVQRNIHCALRRSAGGVQHQAAPAAIEAAEAELLFQQLDLLAHGAVRVVQSIGRCAQIPQARSGTKSGQGVEGETSHAGRHSVTNRAESVDLAGAMTCLCFPATQRGEHRAHHPVPRNPGPHRIVVLAQASRTNRAHPLEAGHDLSEHLLCDIGMAPSRGPRSHDVATSSCLRGL